MLINDFQSHTGSNGSSVSDRVEDAGYEGSAGENIHTTHGAFNAVQAWMNSAGHRENLLNPSHEEIGVGSANEGNVSKWTYLGGNSL